MIEDNKNRGTGNSDKAAEPAQPAYDESESLGQTMMDVDSSQFLDDDDDGEEKTVRVDPDDQKESVEELLKKEQSLINRIGKFFKKK